MVDGQLIYIKSVPQFNSSDNKADREQLCSVLSGDKSLYGEIFSQKETKVCLAKMFIPNNWHRS